MENSADLGAAVLGLVAAEGGDPAAVLADLVGSVERLVGLTAGAALLTEGAVRGVEASGPTGPRAALAAGFGQGPGGESARTGRPVHCADLARERSRWLVFAAKALAAGVDAAWALPLRHGPDTVGALLVLGPADAAPDLQVLGLLAEAAAVALLRSMASQRATTELHQLRTALTSRVAVEQAKGMLAVHGGVDVGAAFELLRGHARRNGRPLGEVATSVVHGATDPATILEWR
ncbi:GAF and ANTAR domain-containing protein [Pseudonocardia sp. ICBG1293]|uniref:GAF and ANTAR domain-containing protein n=1 Tax=Pseudonocardia sp. ICBG1293 TaxID=2844382 RepID=UPI001CCF6A70|nr:GAF and ANTAR domain-containing protein [Pseudonocardia sp. ICBG1293]